MNYFLVLFMTMASLLFADPKTVVFDFNGVMTRNGKSELVVKFLSDSLHLSPEEYKQANREKKASGLSYEQFWRQFANDKGIEIPEHWGDQLKAAMKESSDVNPEMYVLIDELKKNRIRVGLLTNTGEEWANINREFGFFKPFDPCLLSYQVGFEKPDPAIFRVLLTELGSPKPKEVVFIDDKADNVEQAKALGIDAILFESSDQIRSELQQRKLL